MTVSFADVLAGAAAHAVPLSAECAGYLVLAAADQAVLAPRQVLAEDVELTPEGAVRLARTRACEESETEQQLRSLLEELLLAASSVTPALLRTGRRQNSGSVASLLREIETALIPVNRAAARRALARLQRETTRALESGKLVRNLVRAPAPAPPPPPRSPSPLPPNVVEMAPPPQQPEASPARPEPSPARVLPNVLTVPNDPVPPPTPMPASRIVATAVVLPSLTPPPVSTVEVETRPEPVVLRASSRPPAPPLEPKQTTPVLGTLVAERRDTLPAAAPFADDEPPGELELGEYEHTETPDDIELIYLDTAGTESDPLDLTEECPPVAEDEEFLEEGADDDALLAVEPDAPEFFGESAEPVPTPLMLTERLALPIVPLVPRSVAVVSEPEPPAIEEPEPSPLVELARTALADAAVLETESVASETVEAEPDRARLVEADPDRAQLIEAEALESDFIEIEFDDADFADAEPDTVAEPDPEPALAAPEPDPDPEPAFAAPEPDPAFAAPEPDPEPAFTAPEPDPVSEVDLAVLVADRNELPAWTVAPAPQVEQTPPPRHALPKAQPSNVDDLLERMGEAPLAVDELRTGLKRLAGLDLTPPPLGITPVD